MGCCYGCHGLLSACALPMLASTLTDHSEVHMVSIEHPIVGDLTYGSKLLGNDLSLGISTCFSNAQTRNFCSLRRDPQQFPYADRLFLHCSRADWLNIILPYVVPFGVWIFGCFFFYGLGSHIQVDIDWIFPEIFCLVILIVHGK